MNFEIYNNDTYSQNQYTLESIRENRVKILTDNKFIEDSTKVNNLVVIRKNNRDIKIAAMRTGYDVETIKDFENLFKVLDKIILNKQNAILVFQDMIKDFELFRPKLEKSIENIQFYFWNNGLTEHHDEINEFRLFKQQEITKIDSEELNKLTELLDPSTFNIFNNYDFFSQTGHKYQQSLFKIILIVQNTIEDQSKLEMWLCLLQNMVDTMMTKWNKFDHSIWNDLLNFHLFFIIQYDFFLFPNQIKYYFLHQTARLGEMIDKKRQFIYIQLISNHFLMNCNNAMSSITNLMELDDVCARFVIILVKFTEMRKINISLNLNHLYQLILHFDKIEDHNETACQLYWFSIQYLTILSERNKIEINEPNCELYTLMLQKSISNLTNNDLLFYFKQDKNKTNDFIGSNLSIIQYIVKSHIHNLIHMVINIGIKYFQNLVNFYKNNKITQINLRITIMIIYLIISSGEANISNNINSMLSLPIYEFIISKSEMQFGNLQLEQTKVVSEIFELQIDGLIDDNHMISQMQKYVRIIEGYLKRDHETAIQLIDFLNDQFRENNNDVAIEQIQWYTEYNIDHYYTQMKERVNYYQLYED